MIEYIYADMHNHTTASDGALTPTKLIYYAHKKGLKAIAITDHDSISGIPEAMDAGDRFGIEIVPGVELNTYYKNREVHILGYYINYHDGELVRKLEVMARERKKRADIMIDNLNRLYDADITQEDLKKEVGKGVAGRPHIARILIRKGIAFDLTDAFKRFIGNNSPAYVSRKTMTTREGVEVIEASDGVPVIAHPGFLNEANDITALIKCGIKGIEVYHPKHTEKQVDYFKKLTQRSGLVVTGGSDCHGEIINDHVSVGDTGIGKRDFNLLKRMAVN